MVWTGDMGINLGDMIVIYWNHSSQHICYPLVIKHGLVQDFGFSFFCFFFSEKTMRFNQRCLQPFWLNVCVFLASEKWGIHQQKGRNSTRKPMIDLTSMRVSINSSWLAITVTRIPNDYLYDVGDVIYDCHYSSTIHLWFLPSGKLPVVPRKAVAAVSK